MFQVGSMAKDIFSEPYKQNIKNVNLLIRVDIFHNFFDKIHNYYQLNGKFLQNYSCLPLCPLYIPLSNVTGFEFLHIHLIDLTNTGTRNLQARM